MIYFLVNNNYHLVDVYNHCEDLKEYEKCLIQVPHTLECINKDNNFKNIFTFNSPFKELKNFFNIFKIKKNEKEIQTKLNINNDDILFVYTEYEILNQYIMSLFKNRGAKVYVLDEGLATYITYGIKNKEKLIFKEKLKIFFLRYFLRYKFITFLKYNNMLFPLIDEKFINGVILYLDVSIIRNIKKILISKKQKKLGLNKNKAIFLNEDMYNHYCTRKEQEIILIDCLEKISNKFETVYFKFHPREIERNKLWQLKIIERYSNIQIIEEILPIENLLEEYNAKYVFSFLSAALLNVNSMGAIPIYIYHLYDSIKSNNIFEQIDLILINANYQFLTEDYEVTSVGFKKNLYDNNVTNISNIIKH